MDIYHIWCNLKPGTSDLDFANSAKSYFEHLKSDSQLAQYRITRRKLGLGPPEMLEFHIMLEFEDLAQLDTAFQNVSSRTNPVECFHHAVNSKVDKVSFALYRDFPDNWRVSGEESF